METRSDPVKKARAVGESQCLETPEPLGLRTRWASLCGLASKVTTIRRLSEWARYAYPAPIANWGNELAQGGGDYAQN